MDIERKLMDLVPESMAERGKVTLEALLAPVRDVLNRRTFPEKPLSDFQVDLMLQLLSSMDSDKDPAAARVGEREGRTASPLLFSSVGWIQSWCGAQRSYYCTAAKSNRSITHAAGR